MINQKNKICLFCQTTLERKTYPSKSKTRGWDWEPKSRFESRNFCNQSHATKQMHLNANHEIAWDKKKILKAFKGIKSKDKYNSVYLQSNHAGLFMAIKKQYGTHYWNKFLTDIGSRERLTYDYVYPKYRKLASILLKYWREELGLKAQDTVTYSTAWGIPILDQLDPRYVQEALKYLINKQTLKLIQTGTRGRYGYASTYQLCKTRI